MSYQNPDKLKIGNDIYDILSCYIPEYHQNIKALSKEEYKSKEYYLNKEYYRNSACRRRYYASWEIKDSKLYLVDLIGEFEIIDKDILFADWYSGKIIIGIGGLDLSKNDSSMPYGRFYGKTLTIILDKGVILDQ